MGHLFASLADGSAAFSAKCTGYESEAASYQDVSLSFCTSRGPLRFITSHSRATRVPLAFRAHLCEKRSASGGIRDRGLLLNGCDRNRAQYTYLRTAAAYLQ